MGKDRGLGVRNSTLSLQTHLNRELVGQPALDCLSGVPVRLAYMIWPGMSGNGATANFVRTTGMSQKMGERVPMVPPQDVLERDLG